MWAWKNYLITSPLPRLVSSAKIHKIVKYKQHGVKSYPKPVKSNFTNTALNMNSLNTPQRQKLSEWTFKKKSKSKFNYILCCGIILLYAANLHYSHWLIIKLIALQQGRIKLGRKVKLRWWDEGGERVVRQMEESDVQNEIEVKALSLRTIHRLI